MKDVESIQDMHTRFTSIINELNSLGEIIPRNKLVRKILSVLPGSWESKVNAITKAKDLQKLTIDELIVKRNQVLDKKFKRNDTADNVGKQALAVWGDFSSESGDDDDQGDNSMMAVESEAAEYDSIFALMAKSDEDEEDDDGDEVNFLDVQRNLKSYSQKKLIYLANILIDAYNSLINNKNVLTTELGEIKHERDDIVVVTVYLRETIKNLKRKKDILTERSANIEHERDELLVVVVDLKETIEELRRESRPMNIKKEKEVESEAHLRLENELKSVKSSLCAELEQNRQLQEDLGRVKNDLEKSLKWTWYSDAITAIFLTKADQDGELSNIPGEVIDIANGKADMMSQVKDSNDNGTAESPVDIEKLDSTITTTEAENGVADAGFKPDQWQETRLPSQFFPLKLSPRISRKH
ncbi:sporulation-specific protein 15-like [Nicotiana tomentosiformis]|uniref:sporulation-specific protein 15-like n=1 Tax=Nicotiana tomentosiformis TaxID=4098 RepID=UPI00388CCB46